jgi:plastocyanin
VRRIRALGLLAAGIGGLLLGSCSDATDGAVTVLVDYDHDEFATQFIRFFPEHVRVHAGDTVVLRQAWTGEPHTVTFGTLVDEVLAVTRPLFEEWGDKPEDEIPPEVFEEYFAAEERLPMFWGPDDEPGEVSPRPQALAQPCLVRASEMPEDTMAPCAEQELPPFDGTPLYYNSGIIPYEGPGGNVFEFTLADDIEPGEYGFYCAVHGSFQSGVLEVVPDDVPLPDPAEVNRTTRQAVSEVVRPLATIFGAAGREEYTFQGEEHPWNYAGLLPEEAGPFSLVNEFVPEDITARVGEPVTWRMFGPHSITFDVPEYFPIVEFLDDGTVQDNADIWPAAGGAPPLPTMEELRELEPGEPLVIDGGTYDGDGFWSTGVLWNDPYVEYTIRFSTPGTYPYACLIHPPMVGTLRVTE